MSSQPIMVVGSANLDLVFNTPRFAEPGETLLGATFAMHPGGKGANQAVAAGRLGANVGFVGCFGSDPFGDFLAENLRIAGVDGRHILRHPRAATGAATITVDQSGQNAIIVASGANMELPAAHVETALDEFSGIVLTQLESPIEAIEACVGKRMLILNPAPAREVPDSLLAGVGVITPNETETRMLTGIEPNTDENRQRAADWLHRKGVPVVIITLGASGCFVSANGETRTHAGHAVRAVDTTAAGDALNGALAVFLAEGMALDDAVEAANRYAALSVTRPGAQASMATREEWAEFFATA